MCGYCVVIVVFCGRYFSHPQYPPSAAGCIYTGSANIRVSIALRVCAWPDVQQRDLLRYLVGKGTFRNLYAPVTDHLAATNRLKILFLI